jgi:Flp pilus assembly protein TadG
MTLNNMTVNKKRFALHADQTGQGTHRHFKGLAGEGGSSLVEFAVSLPILLTFIFCFMEMCLAFYSYNLISELAREGSRYAMVRGASCPSSSNPTCEVTAAQVNSYVSSLGYPNIGAGTITVATTYPNGNESVGSTVKVQVTYVLRITIPLVPKNALTMSSTSQEYIVQ